MVGPVSQAFLFLGIYSLNLYAPIPSSKTSVAVCRAQT